MLNRLLRKISKNYAFREDIHDILDRLNRDGLHAKPVVLTDSGIGPKGVIISMAQYEELADHIDDIISEPEIRSRLEAMDQPDGIEDGMRLEDLARKLGIDLTDRPE